MTPLETVAYHIWRRRLADMGAKPVEEDFLFQLEIWKDAPEDEKHHVRLDGDMKTARAAMLAMADAELPTPVITAAADAFEERPAECLENALRAMLRAIAGEAP